MKDYLVRIEGVVPLMHNRYPLDMVGKTNKRQRGKVFNAQEEVQKCFYRDVKGVIYQPSDHIEGALIRVGSSITKTGRTTYKDDMKTNIAVLPQEIPFLNGEKYTIDVRLCVIPATRGRVPVARPRWDEWAFDFTIRIFDETMLDDEVLLTLLEKAGKTQGIGTFRPKFGRFKVVKFERLQ